MIMRSSIKVSILAVAVSLLALAFASPAFAIPSPSDSGPAVNSTSDCVSSADGYCLLAPLPIQSPSGEVNDKAAPADYIKGVINLAVAAAGVIAVLKLIFAGFTYITSEGFGRKSNAKEQINNALMGLILAIGAFTILKTINPTLLILNLNIPNVGSGNSIGDQAFCPGEKNPDGTCANGIGTGVGKEGSAWFPDQQDRAAFTNFLGSNGINHPNCEKLGDHGCTSLYGLNNPTILSELSALKKDCNCDIQITGGSEFWEHGTRSTDINSNNTPHKPGGSVLDLSLKTSVTDWIRKNAKKSTNYSQCVLGDTNGVERYTYKGALYVNETIDGNAPHWHVCFGSYNY